ncbi:hypothetical protein R4P64_33245 [Rhodococcus sp. IEGM 1366]|nr:hypothetical protein [Rhodococcus sp. IEGM 1366]MDV8071380.1 hypothetical protein [Rhodococcus sp. IEGM 1366]
MSDKTEGVIAVVGDAHRRPGALTGRDVEALIAEEQRAAAQCDGP